MLDGVPYIYVPTVTDLAAHESPAFVTISAYSLELDPVEEYRYRLEGVFGTCSPSRSRN